MDRIAANREVTRLIEYYRSLPASELLKASEGPPIQGRITAEGEVITTEVSIRLTDEGRIVLTATAYGANWWKTERIEETVIIGLPREP